MHNTQQDPQGLTYVGYSDKNNPHNHTFPTHDITLFGALPKVDLDAVRKLSRKAKDEIYAINHGKQSRMCIPPDMSGDSDFVFLSLADSAELLVERVEKLQNIISVLISVSAK